ncbi:pheophorbidase-like isoform X2 [Humulus lupulus]|uniref:pheophorbidase-like isoform X2 n=1 Tax=Humulus lupulus TaxID=3486 RepID=UPI002B40C292|nr:pheophorbidase-like isoform X2 [Humulus lupulus]
MQPKMKTTLYISIILMIILEIRMMNCESGLGSNKQLHFVLVHGAGHGGWCWYKIRSLLEAAGHKVTCLDLKCSGIEPTDFNTVFTFDDYNQPLTTFMSSLSPNHKVIMVGHSAGGSTVTDVVHKFADKVPMAIYVAAAMVNNNSSIVSTDKYSSNQLREIDAYEFIFGLGPDQPPTGVMVKPELRRQVLYNESPVEDFILASMLLRPSPARALHSANVVKNGCLENIVVPRVFIKTMKDKLFKPERQESMIKQWPPSKVFAIDESDHSPFFSTPYVLFALLLEAATSIKMP